MTLFAKIEPSWYFNIASQLLRHCANHQHPYAHFSASVQGTVPPEMMQLDLLLKKGEVPGADEKTREGSRESRLICVGFTSCS